jgi:hypothetical protein
LFDPHRAALTSQVGTGVSSWAHVPEREHAQVFDDPSERTCAQQTVGAHCGGVGSAWSLALQRHSTPEDPVEQLQGSHEQPPDCG